jgi:thiol-disulfide isomerase/thioredoxin
MKKGIWFVILALFFSVSIFGQEINKKIMDERLDREVLIGYCDKDGLQDGEFGETYFEEYEEYNPQMKYIKKISEAPVDYKIVLVLASWCHDSKEQVPRFFRIMDDAGIPDKIVTIICVDGNKKGGDLPIDEYGIERVPTFIFYRDGNEFGRIIETPDKSLERDMWKIIK